MRYFALLYVSPDKRATATALFLIDAEIRESAQSVNHDVAHTRLQWWRQEIDRLVNANAQHPATRLLSEAAPDPRRWAKLHELVAGADMDLARMTYRNSPELRAYCSRSGGAICELLADYVAYPAALDEGSRAAANRIGALVRATEIVRDARQDAYEGRLYLPLDVAEKHGFDEAHLKAHDTPAAARRALGEIATQLRAEFTSTLASIPHSMRAYLRAHFVLAGLHDALLARMARRNFAVGAERIELGPISKPWIAWRAARRAK